MPYLITVARLRQLLAYNPDTGLFTDRDGAVQGSQDALGYIRVRVDGESYRAHRLAWLYIYGQCPKLLDHINGDAADNRIANLRPASHAENMSNRTRANKNSKTGVRGVSARPHGRYRARVRHGGKEVFDRYYPTLAEAEAAVKEARRRVFGQFAGS